MPRFRLFSKTPFLRNIFKKMYVRNAFGARLNAKQKRRDANRVARRQRILNAHIRLGKRGARSR